MSSVCYGEIARQQIRRDRQAMIRIRRRNVLALVRATQAVQRHRINMRRDTL
jgi:hypothetical protein